jgi:predicted lactoylglutathione lyase
MEAYIIPDILVTLPPKRMSDLQKSIFFFIALGYYAMNETKSKESTQ